MDRLKYMLLLFLILSPAEFYGQYFKKLTMKDGLSSPSVLAIYQDTLGRMWFGTNEGVNVYDSKEISKYKSYDITDCQHRRKNLINGVVNQIIGDSNGDILMLNSGALIKYDIRKERFKELLPAGVGALATLDGEVWCTVHHPLYKNDTEPHYVFTVS